VGTAYLSRPPMAQTHARKAPQGSLSTADATL
jgi:hypothetical protein